MAPSNTPPLPTEWIGRMLDGTAVHVHLDFNDITPEGGTREESLRFLKLCAWAKAAAMVPARTPIVEVYPEGEGSREELLAQVEAMRKHAESLEAAHLRADLRARAMNVPGPVPRALFTRRHDLINAFLPVVEAMEMIANVMGEPPGRLAVPPEVAAARILSLCVKDEWLAKRRANLTSELEEFNLAVDRALQELRARYKLE